VVENGGERRKNWLRLLSSRIMSKDRLVYSTRDGRVCPDCGRGVSSCSCKSDTASPPDDGIVRVRRETAHRGGKVVTAIMGVPGDDDDLAKLAGDLKRRCGTGGTVKDGIILIQGDRVEMVITELQGRGFKIKRAGG
jgi:translation initiation factor 1